MSDVKFVDGLFAKAPNDNAPDYVKGKLSIKREEMANWLLAQTDDWINVEIKVSQGGKWYTAVDDWKPDPEKSKPARAAANVPPPASNSDFDEDGDVPF